MYSHKMCTKTFQILKKKNVNKQVFCTRFVYGTKYFLNAKIVPKHINKNIASKTLLSKHKKNSLVNIVKVILVLGEVSQTSATSPRATWGSKNLLFTVNKHKKSPTNERICIFIKSDYI